MERVAIVFIPLSEMAELSFTVRVQRGPSEAARCASTKDTQPSRLHSWFLQSLSRIRRVRQPGAWVQCPDAVVAPMPVSDLTSCARKPPRSFTAWLLRSRIENNQMPTNPIVIENSAGEVYGNNALPFG